MLIYSTRFRVVPAFDKKRFVNSVIEWNRSGQYSIDDIEENSFSFIAGDDSNCLEVTDLEKESVMLFISLFAALFLGFIVSILYAAR